MIYLVLFWLIGLGLTVFLQCWLSYWRWLSLETADDAHVSANDAYMSAPDAAAIIITALAWPAVVVVAVVTMLADMIHFLIEVVKKPH